MPKISWRKLLWVAVKSRNSWKFSPSKVSHYIVVFTSNRAQSSLDLISFTSWCASPDTLGSVAKTTRGSILLSFLSRRWGPWRRMALIPFTKGLLKRPIFSISSITYTGRFFSVLTASPIQYLQEFDIQLIWGEREPLGYTILLQEKILIKIMIISWHCEKDARNFYHFLPQNLPLLEVGCVYSCMMYLQWMIQL